MFSVAEIRWGRRLYAVIIEMSFISEATESIFLFPRISIYRWSKHEF